MHLPVESVAVARGCVIELGKEIAEGKGAGSRSARNASAAGWPEAHVVEVDVGVDAAAAAAADCVLGSHYLGRGRFRPSRTAHSLSSRRTARSRHAGVRTPWAPPEQAG